jgi:hypothetical protein
MTVINLIKKLPPIDIRDLTRIWLTMQGYRRVERAPEGSPFNIVGIDPGSGRGIGVVAVSQERVMGGLFRLFVDDRVAQASRAGTKVMLVSWAGRVGRREPKIKEFTPADFAGRG